MERGFPNDDLAHPSIDKEKLKVQLDDMSTVLGLYNVDRKKKIASVSRISTIAEISNSLTCSKAAMLPGPQNDQAVLYSPTHFINL